MGASGMVNAANTPGSEVETQNEAAGPGRCGWAAHANPGGGTAARVVFFGKPVSGHWGRSTPSTTWMTPFDCITSPMVTL